MTTKLHCLKKIYISWSEETIPVNYSRSATEPTENGVNYVQSYH